MKTNIDVHPRPVSDRVLKADLARATGFNNDRPVKDVSADLQSALDAVKAAAEVRSTCGRKIFSE